ncbi:MAG: ABC transporter ATP-binding protein, partial [Deltaproteobacteria bacterium]|nr:ABC transporter ATP-binding protein [Deltaproteobacteria bacterium]
PVIRRAIHQLIKQTQEKFGFTAVIVSHDIPDIFEVAHYVAMLYQGEILQFGTPEEIRESQHPVVKQFISGSLDGPINSGVA